MQKENLFLQWSLALSHVLLSIRLQRNIYLLFPLCEQGFGKYTLT